MSAIVFVEKSHQRSVWALDFGFVFQMWFDRMNHPKSLRPPGRHFPLAISYLRSLTQHFNPPSVLHSENLSLAPNCSLQSQFSNCLGWIWFHGTNARLDCYKKIRAIPFLPLHCSLEGIWRRNSCPYWTIPFHSMRFPPHTSHPRVAFINQQSLLSIFGSSFHSSDLPLGAGSSRDLKEYPILLRGRQGGTATLWTGLREYLGSLTDPCMDAGTDLSDSREWRDQERRKSWQVSSWDVQGGWAAWTPCFQSAVVVPANEI